MCPKRKNLFGNEIWTSNRTRETEIHYTIDLFKFHSFLCFFGLALEVVEESCNTAFELI